MKIVAISFVLFLTGCVTMIRGTPHEYCTKHAAQYASYDQCYAEETEKRRESHHSMSTKTTRTNCSTFGTQTSCQTN